MKPGPLSSSIAALCIFTFLTAPPASAQEAARKVRAAEERFKQLDTDGNGELSKEEMAKYPWVQRLDLNGDGVLTMDEAREFFAQMRQPSAPATPSATPAPAFVPEDSPRLGPKLVKAGEAGVGRQLPDLELRDLEGQSRTLSQIGAGQPVVVALVSSSCPVSKRYLPTLGALQKEYEGRGARFILVAPTATDTPEALRAVLQSAGLTAPCVPDPTGALSRTLGAESTTDVFVLDAARTLLYRGAVDDQYGLGYSLEAPRKRFLASALDAVLAGQVPAVQATEAPGCVLDLSDAAPVTTAATYHNRISRIVQANCQECHREQGMAPFPLETYEQVVAKAGMIRRMVGRDLMPPWFAAPVAAGQHSPWANDRSLAPQEKTDLLAWLEADKPAGDPKDAPLPRTWPGEWQLGKPDAVVQIPQPIAVKATGTMPYQYATVETSYAEDRWVRGLEVQPTAREVVHHVLIFAQEKGKPLGRGDDGLNGFFAAYVPGSSAVIYPDGYAKKLPAGARIVFQIHYTPNGTATHDQVRMGMLFSAEPPKHEVRVAGIANTRLSIPAGAENHPETASIPVPRAVKILGLMPHMHVRGKSFRFEVILPGGETRSLLEVPRYDFNWQLAYRYTEPVPLPAGSKVRATGWFDNSANNPANPDPAKTVRWGQQTHEEMMLGYVEYIQVEQEQLAGSGGASPEGEPRS